MGEMLGMMMSDAETGRRRLGGGMQGCSASVLCARSGWRSESTTSGRPIVQSDVGRTKFNSRHRVTGNPGKW